MGRPTLVLDANAFSSREFRYWLTTYKGRKILPMVAFVEVGVHEASQGRLERFRAYLMQAEIEIEWMRVAEAQQTIRLAVSTGGFADNARDYLIAGHVHGERILVTSNSRDFAFLPHVVDPKQAIRRFS